MYIAVKVDYILEESVLACKMDLMIKKDVKDIV